MSEGTIFMSGDPDCTKCGGRGVIRVDDEGSLTPTVEPCQCVIVRRVMDNVNRGWKGLLDAPRIDDSPLLQPAEENNNLWVTGNTATFRSHLRHVALRMGPKWGFKVVTDADLMIAWLASAKLEGLSILDPEVAAAAAPVSATKASLPDLVKPPDVLIVVLGVKAARNAAMPEVLYEALNLRVHDQKPVWIIDQPHQRLALGHRAFDQELSHLLDGFPYFQLEELAATGGTFSSPEAITREPSTSSKKGRNRIGLSQGHGNTSTSSVEAAQPKKKSMSRFSTNKRGGKR